jgi:glutamate N-acetyltransferase/amino-acid N-acetyltransferase
MERTTSIASKITFVRFSKEDKLSKIEYFDRFIAPKGFKFAGVESGIKSKGKDLGLIFSDVPCKSAAVYTSNVFAAAPIQVSKEHQHATLPQAIIVNSGNANAATGKQGLKDAYKMAEITAKDLGLEASAVLVSSTGIIGKPLPIKKIEKGIIKAKKNLSHNAGDDVAEAILTTDKVTKVATVQFKADNQLITLSGMAKGSGMINPDMLPQATMLAFIVTDIRTRRKYIKKVLTDAVNKTFNAITVDGDTSTNDMVVILANGAEDNHKVDEKSPDAATFEKALNMLCASLAEKIVKDGEGATKFVTVEVGGAKNEDEAKKCAKSIANSLLVKTALYGQDPNWGRILAVVGYSGVDVNPAKISISYNGILIVKNGGPVKFDTRKLKTAAKKKEILLKVSLGVGKSTFKVLTNDLSEEYIKINAEYST